MDLHGYDFCFSELSDIEDDDRVYLEVGLPKFGTLATTKDSIAASDAN
jgi:hypothetical protein